MLGEFTRLTVRDLLAFLVFSQHPAWFYCAGKPIERVVYYITQPPLIRKRDNQHRILSRDLDNALRRKSVSTVFRRHDTVV